MNRILLFIFFLTALLVSPELLAQDTLRIDLQTFIKKGVDRSQQLKAEEAKVERSQARYEQASASRFLPNFELVTNHGIVPSVISKSGLPREEWHLDPNLENDWENWSIFTRIELKALQPLFTWGAIANAVEAAEMAAKASRFHYAAKEQELYLNLYTIYQSKILSMELNRLVDDALDTFRKAEKEIENLKQDSDLEEKEIFKFKIYKNKFLIKAEEVKQNIEFIDRTWRLILDENQSTVLLPKEHFLTITEFDDQPIDFFESHALKERPEVKALNSLVKASEAGVSAERAQRFPLIYFGAGGEYVRTPRPANSQPFVGDRFNYFNPIYSFGIRQSLNFSVINTKVDQAIARRKEAKASKKALNQGISLQISESYKQYKIANSKVEILDEALLTSKEWLRTEEIDYDLGLGEIKDLVDAMKNKLELEAEYLQSAYDYNIKLAKLLYQSGMLETFINQ